MFTYPGLGRALPKLLQHEALPTDFSGTFWRTWSARSVFFVALVVATAGVMPASALGDHDAGVGTGNDQIAGALELTFFNEDFDFTDIFPASIQANEPRTVAGPGLCEGREMGATLWWFVSGNGGPITVTTLNSDFDTLLGVYRRDNGDFVGCSDDVEDVQAELVFASEVGVDYLLQVGGLCGAADPPCNSPDTGTVAIDAYDAPANDNRGGARSVSEGNTLTGQRNFGATLESGELASCGGASYGKTTWYRWVAPATGDAVFSASSSNAELDPVLAAYLGGGGSVACNDDVSATDTQARVSRRVQAGETYLLQVGGFGPGQAADDGTFSFAVQFTADNDLDDDGSSPPADCNDNNPAIYPGARDVNNGVNDDCVGLTDPDRDGDGFARPPEGRDCNDAPGSTGRRTHPGATDVRGNRVNEDCVGGPAPFRRLTSDTDYSFKFVGSGIVITTPVLIRSVPRGSRVRLVCRRPNRRSCGTLRTTRRSKPVRFRQLRGKRLPAGTVLLIRVTKRNYIGRFIKITVRRGKEPRKRPRCMNPGTSKPQKTCPSLR